ncbi:hypothetical protein G7054_g12815 [Neopestalotiopsis clavispora]|nr:hypothetical protein G7054_g12815 [Neopestalotiopsis clavispora]
MYRARPVLRLSNLCSTVIRFTGVVPRPSRESKLRGSYQSPLCLPHLRTLSYQSRLPPEEHGKNIEWDLHFHQHDKWGWVIYRTAYGDDAAWERFKQFVMDNAARGIAQSTAPGIANTVEWTFVSDQETLDGASTGQLRARFRGWAAEAIRTENPRATGKSLNKHFWASRYSFCIEVSEETLEWVAKVKSPRDWELVWVKFIQADWEYDPEEDDGGYELIDGNTAHDVGWMLIESCNIAHWFYDIIGNGQYWYLYYNRPPDPCCP